MGLFNRIRPTFVIPPAEASTVQRLADLQSRTDAALRLIDGFAAGRDPDVRDAVLEVRLALRPAVPVVPGYVDAPRRQLLEEPVSAYFRVTDQDIADATAREVRASEG
jgi:hypothetical protein